MGGYGSLVKWLVKLLPGKSFFGLDDDEQHNHHNWVITIMIIILLLSH